MDHTRLIVGCMTGTSLDGLDAVLVRTVGRGLTMRASSQKIVSLEMPTPLRQTLASMAAGDPHPAGAFAQAARELGQLHAQAVASLLEETTSRCDFVVAHGQTICHAPGRRLSWQLMDPWPLVAQLRVPVLYDLRQADLIAGGQGAPITPLADYVMLRHPTETRAVVNLGGICNATTLPAGAGADRIAGRDIGPCNLLLDALAHRLLGQPFDDAGRAAARGTAHSFVFDEVKKTLAALPPGASLGREQFGPAFAERLLACRPPELSEADVLASAVEAAARVIAEALRADRVILAGGGVRHALLVERLGALCAPAEVTLIDELGWPSQAREAAGFAVLGALCADGVPITLPQVTGASQPGVAGTWAGLDHREPGHG